MLYALCAQHIQEKHVIKKKKNMKTLNFEEMVLIEGGIKWKCLFSIAAVVGGAALLATGVGGAAGGAVIAAGVAGVNTTC